jgi:hypothetical protein
MHRASNPALDAFLAVLPESLEFAQVLVTRRPHAFELRHVADRAQSDSSLEILTIDALRALANYTSGGAFRPLKSAPTLRSGWRTLAHTPAELEVALEHLYPGALADWFAVQEGKATGAAYRDFVDRQTGMYRITQMLSDEQVADLAGAGCQAGVCLKRRLWHGPLLKADAADGKSLVPCLEPCAIVLEFARKSMRLEQEEQVAIKVAAGDLQTLLAAVESALATPQNDAREADFSVPTNPRRLCRTKILLQRWLAEIPGMDDKE